MAKGAASSGDGAASSLLVPAMAPLDETLMVIGGIPNRGTFGVDDARWTGWEMSFFAGALAAQLDRCDASYARLIAGPVTSVPAHPDSSPIDLDALTHAMGELTDKVETILSPDRVAMVFGPDRPVGDVQPMLAVAAELGSCYEGLLAYAINLRSGVVPAFRLELLQAFADLVTLPIEQFREFVASFAEAALRQTEALRSGVDQPVGIKLTLELSVDPAAQQRVQELTHQVHEALKAAGFQ